MVHGKIWIPIIDGQNNRDILKYAGIWQHGVQITSPNRKFFWDITLTKRAGFNLNYNVQLDFGWRMFKKPINSSLYNFTTAMGRICLTTTNSTGAYAWDW